MSKPISKTRQLIRIIQNGKKTEVNNPDLAFVAYVAEKKLEEYTVFDIPRVKIALFRRLALIAENINNNQI